MTSLATTATYTETGQVLPYQRLQLFPDADM